MNGEPISLDSGAFVFMSDVRHDKGRPWGFVRFRDSFMSNWGAMVPGAVAGVPRISWYALAVADDVQADVVLNNGNARSEMRDGFVLEGADVPDLFDVLRDGDHIQIVDSGRAPRWYRPCAFERRD